MYGHEWHLILFEEVIGLVLMQVELEHVLLSEGAGEQFFSE